MNDYREIFAEFDLLQPSTEESAAAVEKTRAAIIAAATMETQQTTSGTSSGSFTENKTQGWRNPLVTTAAIAIVGVLAWLTLAPDRSVMAEVLRQMVRAKSIRCVTEVSQTGNDWMMISEFLYHRDHGVLSKTLKDGDVVRTDLDDGSAHWIQRKDQATVIRENPQSTKRQLERLLAPLSRSTRFQHIPDRDKLIDGELSRHFFGEYEEHNQRVSMWIDPQHRLREAEMAFHRNGVWTTVYRTSVEYDIDVAAGIFSPDFGESAKVVDLTKVFDEVASLKAAIHRSQHFGYELAVHDLKRIGDYEYYVLISFRPTDELRRRLDLTRGEQPGSISPSVRNSPNPPSSGLLINEPPLDSEAARQLAVATADGVTLMACLCRLNGHLVAPPSHAKPQFMVFTHPDLWKSGRAQRAVQLELPLPDKVTSLRDVVKSAYDMISTLELVPMRDVHLHDELDDRTFDVTRDFGGGLSEKSQRINSPRPSEISFATFFEHIQNAPWQREERTRSVYEKEQQEWQHDFGAKDPLVFLENMRKPDIERPEMWLTRMTAILKLPNPPVQLAALKYCAEVQSLRWIHALVDLSENAEDSEVKEAAKRTLDLYRRPVAPSERGAEALPAEISADMMKGLMQQLLTEEDVDTTIKQLRELTSLNYGDGKTSESRARWNQWWSYEQASIAAAANGNREFIIYGKITDSNGDAMPGSPAEITLEHNLNNGGNKRAAYTLADDDGRYVLRFGFVGQEPRGLPIVQRRFGSPKPNESDKELEWGYVSRYEFDDDPISEPSKKFRFTFSGRPDERNLHGKR